MARHGSTSTEFLTGPPGVPVVYLLDAASDLEVSMLSRWLRSELGSDPETLRITSSRKGRGGETQRLADLLVSPSDKFLIPARVVWLAPKQDGRRSVSWLDLLRLGDPRDPKPLRARWIRAFRPGRVRFIAARGAQASEMARDFETSGQVEPLTSYVTRRAWLVLDRAERRLRGNRYKIPRFVPEAILSRREFVEAVSDVAKRTGTPDVVALEKAERYLREIAATHSPHVIDLIANAIHKLYSQGYSEIRYSEADVQMIAGLAGQTVVFLPSHRSNLDRLSLQFMLWENDLPPNHTAGGINLNFFPVGPLVRRTGVFFIRRTFKDNPLYRTVLLAYIDYLVEKRFPLEWYMEGGRSRSGKLLPPRLGLLSYVVDAYRRGKAEEIQFVPVSIAYDQIQDVPDYAREAQGKTKEKESLGWLVRAIRSLRRRYGDIHIRFAEPVAVSSVIGSIEGDDESSVGLQKLAFEVMYRIARVTPITPTALVSVALLAARGAARSIVQLEDECRRLIAFIEARGLPTTEHLDAANVEAILDWLSENGYVSQHEALERKVFWLDEDQMIRISYYRNVIVHYFVNRAIAEVALRAAVETGGGDIETIEGSMLALRDLLKFEFFFPDKEAFLEEVADDISLDVTGWAGMIRDDGPGAVLDAMPEPLAYWSVLPFLDAYQVVGDELEAMKGRFDEKPFLKACLDRARMYRIEERLISGESASQVLFKSALDLARNRDLIEEGPETRQRRMEFAAEVRTARRLAAAGL
ncbi:MAG: 1-acyl-sn-glycerol-3-phosphate acyltransferase [Acidimicrobiia bacterium]